jgi:hypothetical protein
MEHKEYYGGVYAATIGPEQDTLIIASAKDWIDCDEKIACEDGWVELKNMR